MSRSGGSRCVGSSQALLRGCPPSSSTEAPAPPLAPTPPAPVSAPANRPPLRFLARVSMCNLAQVGHPSEAPERVSAAATWATGTKHVVHRTSSYEYVLLALFSNLRAIFADAMRAETFGDASPCSASNVFATT